MKTAAAILSLVCATAWADDGPNPCGGGNPCGGYDPCGGSWTEPDPMTQRYHLCVEVWALAASSSKADNETCSHYFAKEGDFNGDMVWKVPTAQVEPLIKRLSACSSCDTADGAIAWMRAAAKAHVDLVDSQSNVSIEPLLEKELTGKKLVAADVANLSSTSLWKLRNAPYARHGRAFKTADLQTFFYGDRGKDAPKTTLLPLKVNPKFTEAMLDKADDGNVGVVMAEIHKRGEK